MGLLFCFLVLSIWKISEAGETAREEKRMYTFQKCDPGLLPDNRWNLLNINDMGQPGYTVDEECLTIGRVITRFGKPDYTNEDMEDLYSCAVSAIGEDGNTVYLEIYYGPSGNAIGGNNAGKKAAEELREWIQEAEPADYRMECVYEDIGASVVYSVKDGVSAYETQMPEGILDLFGIPDL